MLICKTLHLVTMFQINCGHKNLQRRSNYLACAYQEPPLKQHSPHNQTRASIDSSHQLKNCHKPKYISTTFCLQSFSKTDQLSLSLDQLTPLLLNLKSLVSTCLSKRPKLSSLKQFTGISTHPSKTLPLSKLTCRLILSLAKFQVREFSADHLCRTKKKLMKKL